MIPELNEQQRERFSRHLLLPEIGEEGQLALLRARVLVVGMGGLGSPASLYLTAAGVGTLGLLDNDIVALSNLQRQVIHTTPGLGSAKVDSACQRLRTLNPETKLELHILRLTGINVDDLVRQYDVVIDCSDNFATRYLLNASCRRCAKPLIYGAVSGFQGQLSVFLPDRGPCYECLYPDIPTEEPSGGELGLLGAIPGVIGTLQAIECLKLILNIGKTLVGRLLLVDALQMQFREIALHADPACRICRATTD